MRAKISSWEIGGSGFQKVDRIPVEDDRRIPRRDSQECIAVNPNIAIIPEIYPGIEDAAPAWADVYRIYPLVDAIAHE